MACSIGIDAGSKTIKVVVLDESGNVLHSVYRRHRSDIRSTLAGALREISWRFEDVVGAVGVTGSAGIPIAASLDVPFVQEVVATTMAVERRHPQADAIVELGGEDAKLVYLTGGLEQRMNATCAGGTGGFIDTVAFMIGAKACDVSKLARSAKRIYPISSRCAVFAQTDIRPLLNEGAGKADIAASALEAVVRQTLGGLACGRPIDGTVVFLGGPIEHIPELTHRFRIALGLDHRSGIKPVDAHLYTAFGAAFYGEECVCRREGRGRIVSLRELEYRVAHSLSFGKPLARLPRLFSSDEEIDSFRGRHAACATPRVRLFDCEGPLYLGFDAGSTAVKLAVLDDAGRLAYFDCRSVGGDVLGTSMRMLEAFYAAMPRAANGNPYVSVARSAVCGYGEGMLKATLGLDEGVVETLAHVRAARELCPDLTFLLDIGGQDMKAIWVRNGRVVDAVLNEACSSGCGSFVEGTAYSLSSTPEEFAVGALLAPEPVDLGTKCTVFMTSRVRHAQKAGASVPDIAAGVAYSVVKNALFRIIGASKVGSLGERVVVQGGTFMSDAVLRAFELVSGIEVVRPERSFLMGAMGAALVAKDRARLSKDNEGGLRGGLVGEEALRGISLTRRGARCEKCGNECPLSIVDFGEGRVFVSGNRCDRAYEYLGYGPALSEGGAKRPPNVVALERKLLARHSDHIGDGPRARIRVGLMNTLNLYEHVPFWHTFFKELGFSIVVPNDERSESTGAAREGSATVPSESACHPAKLSHSRLTDLTKNGGAHAVFMPRYTRGRRCPVSCDYSAALFDGELGEKGEVRFLSPLFKNVNPMFLSQCGDRDALAACIDSLLEDEGLDSLGDDLLDRALSLSFAAQARFESLVSKANDRALAWARVPGRRGAVIGGRPYHVDAAVMHGVDAELSDLGVAVLSPAAIGCDEKRNGEFAEGSWGRERRLTRLARFVVENPSLELVCFQSFGCGYDAASIPYARQELEKEGKGLVVLKIDSITDTAHARIRLRTLFETIDVGGGFDWGRVAGADYALLQRLGCSGTRGEIPGGKIERRDIDVALATMPSDFCIVAKALAGRAVRRVLAERSLESIGVPAVCKRCMLDAVPDAIERVCDCGVRVYLTDEMLVDGRCDVFESAGPPTRPRVGILGNALLVFDSFMNDGLVALIESEECEVVLPRLEGLLVDDVRYVSELDRFSALGVVHVIYLQAFGCLKGHVQARGSLRLLERRYPDMQFTVIDYDVEASALNRENRVLLALAAAKRAFYSY